MWLAPLLSAAMINAGTQKEAEKAFEGMSATLTRAKSFACTFELKVAGPQGKGSFKGRLVVAQGNKVRIEMDGEGGGKTMALRSVSDGRKTVAVDNKIAQPARDTPKNMAEQVLTGMARGGLFVPMFLAVEGPAEGEKRAESDVGSILKVSDFQLGKKEKVDGKEAQAIEYTLTVASAGGEKINTTVWVGVRTHVPLQRLLIAKIGGQEMTVKETYSHVVVDRKIDAKTFELPE
jgi:outer membrane lipoprotein-sorting protein